MGGRRKGGLKPSSAQNDVLPQAISNSSEDAPGRLFPDATAVRQGERESNEPPAPSPEPPQPMQERTAAVGIAAANPGTKRHTFVGFGQCHKPARFRTIIAT